ncbi:hypothetical protein [Burkholderia cenocepacia]|uniref:hypothetical protein n=1 Tax=Burkholderia cenocepacia TaxID=95486 RepID=UPI002B254891|nr:hypothetical protein [Burkholderia cenocepacia]MEB2540121.1 hypothetical protein [Burkholderia cenocepacia]
MTPFSIYCAPHRHIGIDETDGNAHVESSRPSVAPPRRGVVASWRAAGRSVVCLVAHSVIGRRGAASRSICSAPQTHSHRGASASAGCHSDDLTQKLAVWLNEKNADKAELDVTCPGG